MKTSDQRTTRLHERSWVTAGAALLAAFLIGAPSARGQAPAPEASGLLAGEPASAEAPADSAGPATPAESPAAGAPPPASGGADSGSEQPASSPAAAPHQLGQVSEDTLAGLALEELLEIPVAVATRGKRKTLRDSPGVVTVITRDEIMRLGARDLRDLLALVPGFQFGTDVMDLSFPGVRGLWAAEGKWLLLVDGHEAHEPLYTNTPTFARFSADLIDHIEVIRGPGSVIYGGAAELAVVNVVTLAGAQRMGGTIAASHGNYLSGLTGTADGLARPPAETLSRSTLSLSTGQLFENGLKLSGSLYGGLANRSDRSYVDVYGDGYGMLGQAQVAPLQALVSAEYHGLQLSWLVDWYRTLARSDYDAILPAALPLDFFSSSLVARYTWAPLPDLRLTPQLRYVYSRPWHDVDPSTTPGDLYYEDSTEQRVQLALGATWDPLPWLNVLAGMEYAYDWSHDPIYFFIDPATWDPDDPDAARLTEDIAYHNVAAYAQALLDSPWVNLSAGARAEYNNRYGVAFVPRLGLTRAIDAFHAKLLFSQAFRPPSNRNLAFTPDIRPEQTTVLELELGYRLGEHLAVTANGFWTDLRDPIVYFSGTDEAGDLVEGFGNFGRTGSRGAELELRYKSARGFGTLVYSYYDVSALGALTPESGMNAVPAYAVPGQRHVLLGFSPHTVQLRGGVELASGLTLGATALFVGPDRFGIDRIDPISEEPHYREFEPELTLNVYLLYRNLFARGFFIGLGLNNVLGAETYLVMPYDGWHGALPGAGPEAYLKAGYDFSL